MKPAPFDYYRATSVEDALDLLDAHGQEDVKVLAGGQSLLTLMNLRLARPEVLVDIGRLAELDRLFEDDDRLVLGALSTHRTVETDPRVSLCVPLLSEAARHIAHVGIRNRGTLGGTLSHSDPAAELPAAMVCLDATFHLDSIGRGRRDVPASEFFVSLFTSVLEPDELLTWVSVPRLRAGQGWAFVELAHRPGDYALAGAAVTVTVDPDGSVTQLRGGLLSAADRPLLVEDADRFVGGVGTDLLWQSVARDWATATMPLNDDPDHAQALCRTAVAQALAEAYARAVTRTADPEETSREP